MHALGSMYESCCGLYRSSDVAAFSCSRRTAIKSLTCNSVAAKLSRCYQEHEGQSVLLHSMSMHLRHSALCGPYEHIRAGHQDILAVDAPCCQCPWWGQGSSCAAS